MLKEISIQNFKSINEEQIFTMEASPKSEISEYYNSHVVDVCGEKLLKISSIYGPNGGGKTTLLKAISFLKTFTFGRLFLPINYDKYTSSIFNDSKITTLTAFFIKENNEYGYTISFSVEEIKTNTLDVEFNGVDKKRNMIVVTYEELSIRNLKTNNEQTVFKRNSDNVIESEILSQLDIVGKERNILSSNITVIGYITRNYLSNKKIETSSPIHSVIKPFIDEIRSIKVLNSVSFDDFYYYDGEYIDDLIKNNKTTILSFLKAADFDVDDIRVEIINEDSCEILFIINGKELPLKNNSRGTQKMLSYVVSLIENNNDKIFLADDFDANFHPKLTRAIIEYFSSENNKDKQFIFNSHDILNMDNKLFRRDEIWFAYKDDNHSTRLVPLSNIVDYQGRQIRKDAVYGKQYLEGKYGGDPFIRKALKWEGKDENKR